MGRTGEGKEEFMETLRDYMTLQQVAREFGLRMRGYWQQGSAFAIETDEGVKQVRRLRHPLAEYRFACAAAEFLRGQGFSRLPRAAWAPKGSPIVNVDGVDYTMHDWIPGEQSDLGNICQLTQAVEMLAWFHRCGLGFRPTETPPVRVAWGSWPHEFAARIEEFYRFEDKARSGKEDGRFARHFLKHFEAFLAEAARALEDLESGPYELLVHAEQERGGLCHHDYTAKNLVLRDDGALYLSDFDDLSMDSRLEDLGRFLMRQAHWNLERTLFILQIYHGVNPIAHAEIKCLGAYLRFPLDFWRAASSHFTGKRSDRHMLKQLAEQLPAKRQFLDRLGQADLSFLNGGGPLYNLGFANSPEAPTGKAWSSTAWPATDIDWQQPMGDDEPATEPLSVSEPLREHEQPSTVLEETGWMGVENSWPEAAHELEAASEPERAAKAAVKPLAWRPFPRPLKQ